MTKKNDKRDDMGGLFRGTTKQSTLATRELKGTLYADCRAALKKNHFSDNEIKLYLAYMIDVLYIYREKFGKDKVISYTISKRFRKIECVIVVEGERVNPFEEGTEFSSRYIATKALKPLLVNETEQASHMYLRGKNIVTVSSPQIHSKSILTSPTLWAVIQGFIGGIICYSFRMESRTC